MTEQSKPTPGELDLTRAQWRKSSASHSNSECVEVADGSRAVGVRDSKRPAQPYLAVNRAGWSAFAGSAKTGRFDLA